METNQFIEELKQISLMSYEIAISYKIIISILYDENSLPVPIKYSTINLRRNEVPVEKKLFLNILKIDQNFQSTFLH